MCERLNEPVLAELVGLEGHRCPHVGTPIYGGEATARILAALKIALTLLLLLAQPPPPRPHVPPSVKLLSAGAAPLAPLRYTIPHEQQVTIVASGQWAIAVPAGSSTSNFPVISTPLRLAPLKGAIEFSWLTPSFTGPPLGSGLETMTRQLLGGLEGSGGLLLADKRGIVSRFLLHPGPNDTALDAGAVQRRTMLALEMGQGMLALLVVPFPDEPIGVGARWQVERVALRGPLSFIQVTTFTLEKRVGNVLKLSYRFGGKWDSGSGFLESETQLAVSGGGKTTVDLTLPMPTSLEDEIKINAQLTSKDGEPGTQSGLVRTVVESK